MRLAHGSPVGMVGRKERWCARVCTFVPTLGCPEAAGPNGDSETGRGGMEWRRMSGCRDETMRRAAHGDGSSSNNTRKSSGFSWYASYYCSLSPRPCFTKRPPHSAHPNACKGLLVKGQAEAGLRLAKPAAARPLKLPTPWRPDPRTLSGACERREQRCLSHTSA